MYFPFVEANKVSRRRLEELLGRLQADDYALQTDAGWSVCALLGHMAFWDNRILALLERWKAQGIDASPIDPNAMNDALKPLVRALEPQTAARLCLESARAVDAALEALTPELVQAIEASPTHFRFDRSLHRDDHIAEIERLLAAR